eukprot:6110523-Amphidinium_carterae.1
MERKALFEAVGTSPGRPMMNPDEYPWMPLEDELFECKNTNPHKGPVSRDVSHIHWHRQTEYYCSSPVSKEVEESHKYRCYVCRDRPTKENNIKLKRCLICRDVYICQEHQLSLIHI